MNDKQLGWASIISLGVYFLLFFGNNSANNGTSDFVALVWVGLSVWTAARLINKAEHHKTQ